VLTNERGDILYISGRTGKYLEPAAGRATMSVFAMAREGLRYELSAAFTRALKEDRAVTVRGLGVNTEEGAAVVDLTVQRIRSPAALRGTVMIVLAEARGGAVAGGRQGRGRPSSTSVRVEALTAELQRGREELQSTREEMQTSQEELKSMNEELQSTNEELQSTNEELNTSKEEMQSMNEELQTVNHELHSKVDELSRSNNDMKNLLNSTDIATLFLDERLLVRRFTTPTSKLIKLLPGDTGRPITDLTSVLDYPDLADDAREVLRTLVFRERDVATRDQRWFSVRILPYRTLDNVIDGVVITFSDVTATKSLEERLRVQARELQAMADALPTLVWGCRADGTCDYLSRRWLEYTGNTEADNLGQGWFDQLHPDDRDRVREAWRTAIRTGVPLDTELRLRDRNGDYRWFLTRASPVRSEQGTTLRWYGSHTDVDDLRRRWTEQRGAAATAPSRDASKGPGA
jgi:two-component system CheB/CheR fusion protein